MRAQEYRNFIINKFREEPTRRLTFTMVRKALSGEVNSLQRVFNFLENWGLINYIPDEKQVGKVAPLPEIVSSGPPGEIAVIAAEPETVAAGRYITICSHMAQAQNKFW